MTAGEIKIHCGRRVGWAGIVPEGVSCWRKWEVWLTGRGVMPGKGHWGGIQQGRYWLLDRDGTWENGLHLASGCRMNQSWSPGSHGNCPGPNRGGCVSRLMGTGGEEVRSQERSRRIRQLPRLMILGSSMKRTAVSPRAGKPGWWESCALAPTCAARQVLGEGLMTE